MAALFILDQIDIDPARIMLNRKVIYPIINHKLLINQGITMKKIFLLSLVITSLIIAQDKTDYSPKFSGYVRAWHQTDFSKNQGQFLVKQARLGISGNVNEFASYKFLVDFTRLGKLSSTSTIVDSEKVINGVSANFSDILLDATATITPIENFDLTAGQFKVPFSTDNLRADQNADFANRPLSTNVSPAMRDLGFMLGYKIKGDISAEILAGAFNGSGFNKTENDKSTDIGVRAVVSPVKDLNVSGNYYSGQSAGNDLNYFNFGLDFKYDQFFIDGEFTNKNTNTLASDIKGNAYFVYALYRIQIAETFLTEITPAIRYEIHDPNTSLADNEINRLTFGASFEFAKINFARFRINYELFDYKDGRDNPDALILELQTRF